jgi:hypothetical protein
MGLMDRVKAQATSLAQQANQGMAKLDNLPAQRRADALLRSLGVAVLAERTGRASGDTEAQISRILADIAQHEQQYNVNLVQQAEQAQAQAQQPWQPQQPWQSQGQAQQPWQPQAGPMQGPGEFLTSAPPVDPNMPVPPAAPYGGAPGFGDQPGYQQPTGFPRDGGPTGFPPSTAFPDANPVGSSDSDDEAGQSGFFPPASGV